MDLHATPDQQAFRAELRGWLEANLPWEYGKGLPPRFDDLAKEVAFLRSWQGKLATGKWVGVAWPEAFGGRGAGPVEHFIVQEELARAGAPEMIGRIGINLAGPTLLAHATEEQKARWLPNTGRRKAWPPQSNSAFRVASSRRPPAETVAVRDGRRESRRGEHANSCFAPGTLQSALNGCRHSG